MGAWRRTSILTVGILLAIGAVAVWIMNLAALPMLAALDVLQAMLHWAGIVANL